MSCLKGLMSGITYGGINPYNANGDDYISNDGITTLYQDYCGDYQRYKDED